MPGQTFSMNDTVKERTVENGYTVGTVISGGRFAEELGGGVSTITTTMWHTAFYAGLERVEQRGHSFYISRYLPGLEATVAWGSLDLRFKNDSPYGVLIKASITNSSVTVTMYSTKRYRITAEFGPADEHPAVQDGLRPVTDVRRPARRRGLPHRRDPGVPRPRRQGRQARAADDELQRGRRHPLRDASRNRSRAASPKPKPSKSG